MEKANLLFRSSASVSTLVAHFRNIYNVYSGATREMWILNTHAHKKGTQENEKV